jgi:hypothetical protein
MVPVLDVNNIPLMPCSEKRARLLMERGKAKPYWQNNIFCIKLLVEPSARNYQDAALSGHKMLESFLDLVNIH